MQKFSPISATARLENCRFNLKSLRINLKLIRINYKIVGPTF
ncbi:hypothetical protein D1AOALGA4SA_5569 [Olavius algarvensis Delta 1 endosymbiont]|nr:hypothetical protein D1AOALGA4SA_5569 [Olavius algarvensis Delta 1 endosymbiont]